ncbi:MAG: hypothetical protein FWC39_07315 [Bacteroidetes bacterium]|nr:hypothetical protein [Bacteroidota bacterium]
MFKNLDPRLQKIILVVIVIILAYLAFIFVKPKVQDWIADRKRSSERKKDIDTRDLTYDKTWYTDMAAKLFTAMNGAGTDYKAIYAVAEKLKTKSDWLQLVEAYGTRTLSSGLFFISNFTGQLPESIISELSSSEQKTLNNILAGIGVSI